MLTTKTWKWKISQISITFIAETENDGNLHGVQKTARCQQQIPNWTPAFSETPYSLTNRTITAYVIRWSTNQNRENLVQIGWQENSQQCSMRNMLFIKFGITDQTCDGIMHRNRANQLPWGGIKSVGQQAGQRNNNAIRYATITGVKQA